MFSNSHPQQDERSDRELVSSVKDGDTGAFDALAGRFMPAIKSAAGRFSGLYGMDAEDLFQEGMITLFRAVKNYNPLAETLFSTYAITCINNSMISAVKKHLRNSRASANVNFEELDSLGSVPAAYGYYQDKVGDIYLDKEAADIRELKIATLLSDFERQVLRLYLQGYTYRQSSEILSASSKAIDNALQRVRRKLRSDT